MTLKKIAPKLVLQHGKVGKTDMVTEIKQSELRQLSDGKLHITQSSGALKHFPIEAFVTRFSFLSL